MLRWRSLEKSVTIYVEKVFKMLVYKFAKIAPGKRFEVV